MKFNQEKENNPRSLWDFIRLPLMFTNGGFTLLEILVVVLIIGILGAIALPQYQRAVLKSRYSGMMPIAKALAEGNEVFFLEHGHYSENPADLLVAGRDKNADAYPDGTRVLMYDEDGLSYVRVMNDNVPNARYLVYQKHSTNFPDTTQCEAADDRANELCQALGGTLIEEGNSTGDDGWKAYLLAGQVRSGDTFAAAGSGSGDNGGGDEPGGDEPGGNTEPQTPTVPPCQAGDTPPANMPVINTSETTSNTAIGTPTCVNGKWKYEWTGGRTYSTDSNYAITACTGNSEYECAGSTFSGRQLSCKGEVANACAGSTFSGASSDCEGKVANACAGATFSGGSSACAARVANACTGATFSGPQSNCLGAAANGCAGTEILAGGYCYALYSGSCDGALYGAHPNKNSNLIGSCRENGDTCPTGVPLRGSWNSATQSFDISGWKGNCCNPAYMVSGVCPDGIAVCQ